MSFGDRSRAKVSPEYAGVQVQTSIYGRAIGVTYGTDRVSPNLVWHGDLQAIRQEEAAESGKGMGTPSRVFYTYRAPIIMSLGEGPVLNVRRAWVGKERFEAEVDPTLLSVRSVSQRITLPAKPAVGDDRIRATVDSAAIWHSHTSVFKVNTAIDQTAANDTDSWRGGYPYEQVEADNTPGFSELVNSGRLTPGRILTTGKEYINSGGGVYAFDSTEGGSEVIINYQVQDSIPPQSALQQIGMFLVQQGGRWVSPEIWPFLAENYNGQAISYSGLGYVGSEAYNLTDYAQVQNHLFEVEGQFRSSATSLDARPIDMILDIASNPVYGANVPRSLFADSSAYREMCAGLGILFSRHYDAQKPAREQIKELLEASIADIAWNGHELKIIPKWDRPAGNYRPVTTPVFEFTDDVLIPLNESGQRVETDERSGAGLKNVFRCEWKNRENDYAVEVMTHPDDAAIVAYGRNEDETKNYHMIKNATVARSVLAAQNRLEVAQGTTYRFRIPEAYIELECGDVVTLNSATEALDKVPVMVEKIDDKMSGGKRSGYLSVEARAWPVTSVGAPIIAPPIADGFKPDWNADPGEPGRVVVVEPPGFMVTSGLELFISAASPSEVWGGADVWISTDGDSYRQICTIEQPARVGGLVYEMSSGATELTVELTDTSIQMHSVNATQVEAGRSLFYLGSAAQGEYMTYLDAALISPGRYKLSGIKRGLFGTKQTAHARNADFASVADDSAATTGPIDPDLAGSTVFIKLRSFNSLGGRRRSLDQVGALEYKITGRFKDLRGLPYVPNLINNAHFGGEIQGGTNPGDFYRFGSILDGVRCRFTTDEPRYSKGGRAITGDARSVVFEAWPIDNGFEGYTRQLRFPEVDIQEFERVIAYMHLLPVDCQVWLSVEESRWHSDYETGGSGFNWSQEALPADLSKVSNVIQSRDDSGYIKDYEQAVLKFDPYKSGSIEATNIRLVLNIRPLNWANGGYCRIFKPLIGDTPKGASGLPPWSYGTR